MKGSTRYTAIWNGLWHREHRERLGPAWNLFGYLLSKANKEGNIVTGYKDIASDTGESVRCLGYWMAILKDEGYVTVRKSNVMHIEIKNFRPLSSAKPCRTETQDVAEHKKEGSAKPCRKSCKDLPNQLHDVAEPVARNGNKQRGSENPYNINKYNKYIYSVFEFWNSQKIKTHRDIQKQKKSISAALKNYSVEEINQAIKNYAGILESPDHFFSYRWTLKQFLTRDGGLECFLASAKPFENYKNRNNGNGQWKSQADKNAAGDRVVV